MVHSLPPSFGCPSILSTFEPMPSMCAPIWLSKWHSSCTWGSEAAWRMIVSPWARLAAMMAFSVPVTLASSSQMLAPRSPLVCILNRSLNSTLAPNASRARRCVSTRRRPMRSPPGSVSSISPARASIGPNKVSEPRISLKRSGSGQVERISPARIVTEWVSCLSIVTPRSSNRVIMVRTSPMLGRLCSVTGSSVSSVAARIGKAAFLLPLGVMVPHRGTPPWMMNCSMTLLLVWICGGRLPKWLYLGQKLLVNEPYPLLEPLCDLWLGLV